MVIRYLNGSGGKAITLAEMDSYIAAGIVVCFVFEILSTDIQGGNVAGSTNASAAKAALAALGTSGCPVYFAVDESTIPDLALPYFDGLTSVLQPSQVGVYGEGALCTLLQTEGLATWFWQSESTGFPGNATTLAITHLQQKYNVSPIPGTDLDEILKPDVGQWPRPVIPPPPPPAPAPVPHIVGTGVIEHTVSVPLNASGNGYLITGVPWANYEGVSLQGSDPAPSADNEYWHGTVEAQDRNGMVLVEVVGATERANQSALVFITASA
jgi:hypothetical protein